MSIDIDAELVSVCLYLSSLKKVLIEEDIGTALELHNKDIIVNYAASRRPWDCRIGDKNLTNLSYIPKGQTFEKKSLIGLIAVVELKTVDIEGNVPLNDTPFASTVCNVPAYHIIQDNTGHLSNSSIYLLKDSDISPLSYEENLKIITQTFRPTCNNWLQTQLKNSHIEFVVRVNPWVELKVIEKFARKF